MKLPINVRSASVEIKHAANSVFVVKRTRLNVACNHNVKGRVGWAAGIFHTQVVAANSVCLRSLVLLIKLQLVMSELLLLMGDLPGS